MKLNHVLMFSLAAALSTTYAQVSFAGFKDEGNGGAASAAITFAELKERCLHPDQFNTQRAPQKIVVQCSERALDYVPSTAAQIPLQTSRVVVTSVLADKFHVAASAQELPGAQKGANCLMYKEVERAISVEHPMSCDQILGMKEDLNSYCVSQIASAKGSNPKVAEVRETGRTIDACGGQGVPYPAWDGGQGGKDGKDGKDGKGGQGGKDGHDDHHGDHHGDNDAQGGKDGKGGHHGDNDAQGGQGKDGKGLSK